MKVKEENGYFIAEGVSSYPFKVVVSTSPSDNQKNMYREEKDYLLSCTVVIDSKTSKGRFTTSYELSPDFFKDARANLALLLEAIVLPVVEKMELAL